MLLGVCGCGFNGGDEEPDPHDELRARLGISSEVPIHRVALGGRGGIEQRIVPSRIEVTSGSLVEFIATDGRVRTLDFPLDSLHGPVADFLVRTGQEASPPLVERGGRFILSLQGAPPGRYLFRSRGSGGEGWGEIVVLD